MPQLLEAGLVYKSIPPLYGVSKGNKMMYFTDQVEFVKYVQKIFSQSNNICDISTKQQISTKDLSVLFLINEDYVYELERLSMTYAVEPRLLEMALFDHITGNKLSNAQKVLKNEFRFMNISTEKKSGSFIYEGTIKETNFLFIDQKLLNECASLIKMMKKNKHLYYNMNGNKTSIYYIMKMFERCSPSGLRRFKGLGEMMPEQLRESTMDPNSNRMLIQYTLEDAKEELSIIREYENDRSKLLDLVGNIKRVDLLD